MFRFTQIFTDMDTYPGLNEEIKDISRIVFSVKSELNKVCDELLKIKNSLAEASEFDIDNIGKQIFSAAKTINTTTNSTSSTAATTTNSSNNNSQSAHLVPFTKEVLHKITPKQWLAILKTATDHEQLISKMVKLVHFDSSTQKTNGNLRFDGALKQHYVFIYLRDQLQNIWKEVPLKEAYGMIRENCIDILDWVVKKYIDVPELCEKAILTLRQMREESCIDVTNGEVTRFFEA